MRFSLEHFAPTLSRGLIVTEDLCMPGCHPTVHPLTPDKDSCRNQLSAPIALRCFGSLAVGAFLFLLSAMTSTAQKPLEDGSQVTASFERFTTSFHGITLRGECRQWLMTALTNDDRRRLLLDNELEIEACSQQESGYSGSAGLPSAGCRTRIDAQLLDGHLNTPTIFFYITTATFDPSIEVRDMCDDAGTAVSAEPTEGLAPVQPDDMGGPGTASTLSVPL
jgi:hypothetical protein